MNFRLKEYDFYTKEDKLKYVENLNIEKYIPIYKIDDILVNVTLKYFGFSNIQNKNIKCHLIIKSKKCFHISSDDFNNKDIIYKNLLNMEVFNINEFRKIKDNEYEQIKNNVKNIFDNIKFCKFIGEFIINNDSETKDIDEMIGLNPLIEKRYANCCVCYEKTMTRLICCDGSICIKCWNNIKNKYNIFSLCPLCINFINTNNVYLNQK